ncbi:MAG: cytochrome P450 [Acidobacteriota bacterium]|nr:cytochrome P450 [Acidobacteriota bacterium]
MAGARPGVELAARVVDPALYESDPHPLFAALRAEAPVAWNEERGFWAVTTHEEVTRVEGDHETFCASRGILVDEIGTTYPSPPTILHSDPPAHTRYRRLVQPGFKPSVVKALDPVVRARAEALVSRLEPGEVLDVVPLLAVPLPLLVISEMLGVPEEDWERCYEWSEAVVPGAVDWPEERKQALMAEMVDYLVGATKARRAEPRHDVLSELALAELDGEQLSDAELAMFLVQLLVAGNETTRNLIAAGLVALAERPDQYARLREDPTLVPSGVEELLRWTSPVLSFMRTATRPTELRGVPIAEGDPLLMLFVSANRDETVFGPDAGLLDVGRRPNPHIAFGFGNHFCLGAALARLEGRVVLEAILGRFAGLEVAGAVERTGSHVVAGMRKAELRFGAA